MKKAFKKVISVLLVAVIVFGAAPLAGFMDLELLKFNFFRANAIGECDHLEENLSWETIISPTCAVGTEVATCSLCNASGKTVVVCDKSTYPESKHYDMKEKDQTWKFSYEGADMLVLNFSGLIRLGTGSAYIYLYNSKGELIGSYTGNQLQNAEIKITGDNFKLRFVANDEPMYGFSFDLISAIMINDSDPNLIRSISAVNEHDWSDKNGICEKCGYECKHPTDHLSWTRISEPTCSPGMDVAICNVCGMGEKRLVVCDRSTYPESEHYYASDMDRTWEFHCDGAEKLILKFSSLTATYLVGDFIYIYDSNGKQKGKYSGTQLAEKEIELYGSSFKIRLTSDSIMESYGFRFASISAILPGYRTQELQRIIPAVAEHDWSDKSGICENKCGYECPHQLYKNGVCDVCGGDCITLGHNIDSDIGECRGCGYNCETMGHLVLSDDICSVCGNLGGTCGKNVFWQLSADGNFIVSGTGEMSDWWSKDVPWHNYKNLIKSVIIRNGVTCIGVNAFRGCTNLTSVIIGNNVTAINQQAFFNCNNLSSIVIPDSVTKLGYQAFACSGVKSVTLKNELTYAGECIFEDCTNLSEIIFSEEIKTIHGSMFEGCTGLKSVTIPDSVTKINYEAFAGCTSLKIVTLGSRLTCIQNGAFMDCKSLQSITFPEGITYIGDESFMNCTSLSKISIPDKVIEMTVDTFKNTAYSSNKSNWENNVLYIGNHLIDGRKVTGHFTVRNGTITIATASFWESRLTSIVIPDSVYFINSCSFSGCNNLTSVKLSANLTIIDYATFSECTSLNKIIIPNSITTIGYAAFRNCNLSSITIPDSVSAIDDSAFRGCGNLKVITIGSGVKKIDIRAFESCNNIKLINYNGTREQWRNIVIADDNGEYLKEEKINFLMESGDMMVPGVNGVPGYNKLLIDNTAVKEPSTSTINYGDSIILHSNNMKIPAGGRVEWYANNSNFSYNVSADGTTCMVTPETDGNTTFTAIVYDANNVVVAVDEQTMHSKIGFFDKIIVFFKKLFGLTKTIPQAFKGIY